MEWMCWRWHFCPSSSQHQLEVYWLVCWVPDFFRNLNSKMKRKFKERLLHTFRGKKRKLLIAMARELFPEANCIRREIEIYDVEVLNVLGPNTICSGETKERPRSTSLLFPIACSQLLLAASFMIGGRQSLRLQISFGSSSFLPFNSFCPIALLLCSVPALSALLPSMKCWNWLVLLTQAFCSWVSLRLVSICHAALPYHSSGQRLKTDLHHCPSKAPGSRKKDGNCAIYSLLRQGLSI